MVLKFQSSISFRLLSFIFIIFYSPLVYPVLTNTWNAGLTFVFVILTICFGFILHMFFNTVYKIEDNHLFIQCGFVTYKPIPIAAITKISKSSSILSAPAASLDRIAIHYGTYDQIILSPKDIQAFSSTLIRINPNIVNKLLV